MLPPTSTDDFLNGLFARRDEFLEDDRFRTIADAEVFHTKIVGVSFEGRQSALEGLRVGDELRLEREAQNVHDASATAVCYGALRLGYLRREIAKRLAPHLDLGRRYHVEIIDITGGGERSRGVNIRLRRADVLNKPVLQQLAARSADRARIQQALIGHRVLHEPQAAVIDRVLERKSTLAVLGTGRGKSLCFQLPAAIFALEQQAKTLVLYPLRALANDQFEAMTTRLVPLGLRILRANGALEAQEREALHAAFETGDWDILLSTPEYMQFHRDRFMPRQNRPDFVVVDEAHHIHESRHRPAYGRMAELLASIGSPPVLALTATARTECFRDLVATLKIEHWIIDPSIRENLSVVDARNRKDRVAYIQSCVDEHGKAIVYCNSRQEATKVAEALRLSLPATAFYHAGIAGPERREIEARFRAGEIRFVVATSAFGEGIDLPDVRDVFLYHMNFSFTEFNQQAGRAGRDGGPARIHLLYGERDRRINDFILARSAPTLHMLRQIYSGMRGLADEQGVLRMGPTEIARTLDIDRADDKTIAAATAIFIDAGLLYRDEDEDGRVIRLLPVRKRIDLTSVPRFAEAEAERENFEKFCSLVLGSEVIDLERIIHRPIYPSGVPLRR